MAESVLSAGPITCGLCGSDFEAGSRESERTADDGTTRLLDQWDGVEMPGIPGPGVIMTLTADLYAED